MSPKKNTDANVSRQAKRSRFTDQKAGRKAGPSPVVLAVGLVALVALIGGTVFALTRPSPEVAIASDSSPSETTINRTGSQGLLVSAATHGHDPYPLVEAQNGAVHFALSAFDDYKAHFYTYMHEGRPIEFFVLKSKDGVVRAAFNACDVCYLSKKGYTQQGDEMICNNCGRHFPADQINDVHGGCNPSPLDRAVVDGNTLVIQMDDIIKGKGYF